MAPEWFVSDPTYKEVLAPDLDPSPNPVSDLAALVSASRGLRSKLTLYHEITTVPRRLFIPTLQ